MLGMVLINNLDTGIFFRREGDLRRFANTWQFIYNESIGRGESYQMVIDLDTQEYYILRRIPLHEDTVFTKVDTLANLRTKGEKERRKKKQLEELASEEEELKVEDFRQSRTVEELFYEYRYGVAGEGVQLGRPLDFPNLAEPKTLAAGLEFRDVKTREERITSGQAIIRFSSQGATDFAVVHMTVDDQVFTLMLDPATGEIILREGDIDFEWQLDDKNSSSLT